MSRSLLRFSLVILVIGLAVGLCLGQGTKITILHVNDTHSHLDAYGPKHHLTGTIGGIAKAATVIGTLRATEPNTLFLHAGDALVGDLFFNAFYGVPEFQILSQLGLDAMAVGNHEFEFGPEVLAGVLGNVYGPDTSPMLSANLDLSGCAVLQPFIHASTIKDVAGIKVGIFGMTVPGNPATNSGPVLIKENIGEIAAAQMADLRSNGAQVVIMLSHLGIYLDQIVAANVPGIDVIVGGHDHYAFAKPQRVTNPSGGTTLILQAGDFYQYVGKLSLTVSGAGVNVDGYALIPVDAKVKPEPTIQAAVDGMKQMIVGQYHEDFYNTVVAHAVTDLEETYDASTPWRDTPLGDLVTDAYRNKTGTQLAVTALGLIDQKIYAGPIVGADVFRSFCYGYDQESGLGLKLVTGTIAGSELVKGLELGLSQIEITDDFFLQVSGMEFAYNSTRPAGERVILSSIRIHGKPLQPDKKYTVTLNDGISVLLGMLGITVENITVLPDLEYRVVRDYLHALKNVKACNDHRIVDMGVKTIAKGCEKWRGFIRAMLVKHGCYPNPFNPTTSISFELPQAAHVSLKVFNMLGQEVVSLVDENLTAGVHQRTFDASRLSSGAYFYRLNADGQVQTSRIVLLK